MEKVDQPKSRSERATRRKVTSQQRRQRERENREIDARFRVVMGFSAIEAFGDPKKLSAAIDKVNSKHMRGIARSRHKRVD